MKTQRGFSVQSKIVHSLFSVSRLYGLIKGPVIGCFLLLVFNSAFGQSLAENDGMKTYYLVMLKKGPHRTQDSATAAGIQERHMAHLNKMAETGKMDLAGPLLEDGDIRGICIYNVSSLEEAKRLAEDDPAVKLGRLMVEIHPWYAMKGSCLK